MPVVPAPERSPVRRLLLLGVAIVAVAIGFVTEWRYVLAPLLAFAVLSWLLASLRVLAPGGADPNEHDEVPPMDPGARTLFWCEECGTEVLLLVRGTTRAPSHCGQRMHERTEILNN